MDSAAWPPGSGSGNGSGNTSPRLKDLGSDDIEHDDVVLLDPTGLPAGRAPRAQVHTTQTPLHLAFSCYLLGHDGHVLLTRRALVKRTWPGVWTNAFCGHPRPGEPLEEAIRRHARRELGVTLTDVQCVLPAFRYRAVDPSGTVENELCPVFIAATEDELLPDPDEVMDLAWVAASEVERLASHLPQLVSPWLVKQLAEMPSLTTLHLKEGSAR
jgi:isopentenyl-diphosphate delta-isomerase